MILRTYKPSDCEKLAKLFYDTVHHVNAKDYSKVQLDAWATGMVNLETWNQSFLGHFTIIAEENGIIVGFGDIDSTGYLDRLFIHKDYQRHGFASAICEQLEHILSDEIIFTHASITAKSFFEKRGYTVLKKQQIERNGIFLTNYVMELRRK